MTLPTNQMQTKWLPVVLAAGLFAYLFSSWLTLVGYGQLSQQIRAVEATCKAALGQ